MVLDTLASLCGPKHPGDPIDLKNPRDPKNPKNHTDPKNPGDFYGILLRLGLNNFILHRCFAKKLNPKTMKDKSISTTIMRLR